MKEILISKGHIAFVDDENYEELSAFKWYCKRGHRCLYAYRKDEYTKSLVAMHRHILRISDRNIHVDHKDSNGLNNQKDNLRHADRTENACNRRLRIKNSSGFKGVRWYPRYHKWHVAIAIHGKRIHLGYFDDLTEAAKAYDSAAIILHGEFAKTNAMQGLL